MFRFLLWLLRPECLPSSRKKDVPFWTRSRIYIYRSLLKIKKRHYRRYAVMDIISSENVKIVWERRDVSFENELKRFGYDIRPHMHQEEHDLLNSSGVLSPVRKGLSFRWFCFCESLKIIIDDGEIMIDHSAGLVINGSLRGRLKISDLNDVIERSEMLVRKSGHNSKSSENKVRRQVLFANEKIPEYPIQEPIAPKVIKKKGFDVDTSF